MFVDPLVDNTSSGFFVLSLSPSHFLVDALFHVFFEQQRATFRETRQKAEKSG
jgi:hypothetical protein